jgi:hypothetical protein
MPRFYVVAKEVFYHFTQVEAEDAEEAERLASELTEHDFEYLDGGDWEIVNVEQIHEKPKQANLF